MSETINNLDEASLLGYFESITGVFLTKLILVASITKQINGKNTLSFPFNADILINEIKPTFDEDIFFSALEQGNAEIISNLTEDVITSALICSWGVFELTLKTLESGNYFNLPDNKPVNYAKGIYKFSKTEKKNIELFYYFRNAIVHYNGAYYSYRSIGHQYCGQKFQSNGNEGEKIKISPKIVYSIIKDLGRYSAKAWDSCKSIKI